MKAGRTLAELKAEVARAAELKSDYLVPTAKLRFSTMAGRTELVIPDHGAFRMSDVCHHQVGSRFEIPAKHYDRLRADFPGLFDLTLTAFSAKANESRLIRTIGGDGATARAFLSNRYRIIDHEDVLDHMLPVLEATNGTEVVSCEVTDRRLYVKVTNRRVQTEVRRGDVVQAGLVLRNSEIGMGAVTVEPFIYRLVCLNGATMADFGLQKYHTGRAVESDVQAREIFRDETLAADDRAFLLKVEDTVRAAWDEVAFDKMVGSMRDATEERIEGDPAAAIDALATRFALNEDEQSGILRYLIEGGEATRYGLGNAVTRFSQDVDDYDRATELEGVGGNVFATPLRAIAKIPKRSHRRDVGAVALA